MDRPSSSTVSVDVLTLRYEPDLRTVQLGVHTRVSEPFEGRLALPGVVLHEGERLAEAARRAVQLKLQLPLVGQGQLTVFDEPSRDPRGATLSVVMWGVADPTESSVVQWFDLDEVPALAFDHDDMLRACRPMLVERLWRDQAFTRALTGPTFPVSAAVAITRSISGTHPDRGNLNRRLAAIPALRVSHRKVVLGRGRPGTLWEWEDAPGE